MARRRRRRDIKVPLSRETMVSMGISLGIIGVFFLTLAIGVRGYVVALRVMAALGTLCIPGALINAIIVLRRIASKDPELLYCIVLLVITLIAAVLWIGLYMVGLAGIWN